MKRRFHVQLTKTDLYRAEVDVEVEEEDDDAAFEKAEEEAIERAHEAGFPWTEDFDNDFMGVEVVDVEEEGHEPWRCDPSPVKCADPDCPIHGKEDR